MGQVMNFSLTLFSTKEDVVKNGEERKENHQFSFLFLLERKKFRIYRLERWWKIEINKWKEHGLWTKILLQLHRINILCVDVLDQSSSLSSDNFSAFC